MLSIKNKEPWAFWPTRVCSGFFKQAGNQLISGTYNFEFSLDFTIRKTYGLKSTIFSILPIYTCLNYYNEHMSNIDVHTENGRDWREIKDTIFINKKHNVTVKNQANAKFTVFLDNKVVIETQQFSHVKDPQMIFGATNFPWHQDNHNYCDLDLHEFKMTHDGKIISHHKFNKYFYDKSFDISNNCNFIHKI